MHPTARLVAGVAVAGVATELTGIRPWSSAPQRAYAVGTGPPAPTG